MAAEIITKEDLHSFRQELLQEIKELLSDKIPGRLQKKTAKLLPHLLIYLKF